jgi:hypothetical protein
MIIDEWLAPFAENFLTIGTKHLELESEGKFGTDLKERKENSREIKDWEQLEVLFSFRQDSELGEELSNSPSAA